MPIFPSESHIDRWMPPVRSLDQRVERPAASTGLHKPARIAAIYMPPSIHRSDRFLRSGLAA
jgi:hypothetical protein